MFKSPGSLTACCIVLAVASSGWAQNTTAGEAQARPAVAFPPTPTPAPKAEPLTPELLDAHVLPVQFISRTSDVLALQYGGFRRSQVDPCGCVTNQLGGLDKEARVIARTEEAKIPALQVDAGGFFRDNPDQKAVTQSEFLLKGLGKIGYDAVNVGFTDLAVSPTELKRIASEAGLSLVSANILDDKGQPVFDPYVIKDVTLTDGTTLKVGIIGVTRPRVEVSGEAAAEPSTVVSGASSDSSETLTIINQSEALNKHLAELGEKADFVVVLAYDRRSNAETLVKAVADKKIVDVLVTGENTQIQGSVQTTDEIRVVSGGYEGKQLGNLYVELKDKAVVSEWNKHIDILQTIPPVPEITAIIEDAHKATGSTPPGATPGQTPATPTKLEL